MPADWGAKPCPRCAYVRTALDTNPPWQCPRCHIAYAKYRPRGAPLRARLAAEGREMAAEAAGDASAFVLVLANALALAIAWRSGMGLRELMMVYWIQSVVIGVSCVVRVLSLKRFDTTDLLIQGRRVEERELNKAGLAFAFLLHYGAFHAFYLFFMVLESKGAPAAPGGYALCTLVFVLSHGYSLLHNLRRDAAGRPNIAKLMLVPYARIIPMHSAVVLGAYLSGGAAGFFFFGALKTIADVTMHTLEHHILHTGSGAEQR